MPEVMTYGGTWKFCENVRSYQGDLHLDYENRIIALEVLLPANEDAPWPRLPYKGKIPYICGTLFSGAKILLYNCSTGQEEHHLMQYTRQIVYADCAFWGLYVCSIEEVKFSRVYFDFGNIVEWAGLCKYTWEYSGNDGFNLIWTHKAPAQFVLNEDLTVTFYPMQAGMGGDVYDKEKKVYQHITAEFKYKHPTAWGSIMEDALCIQYFISICLNRAVVIDEVKFSHPSVFAEYRVLMERQKEKKCLRR